MYKAGQKDQRYFIVRVGSAGEKWGTLYSIRGNNRGHRLARIDLQYVVQ